MKSIKKLCALFLAFVMLLSLVACGRDGQTAPETGEPISSSGASLSTAVPTSPDSTNSTQSSTYPFETMPSETDPAVTTTPPTTDSPVINTPPTTNSTTGSKPTTTMSFKTLVSEYSGRWYLDGYGDVYLDLLASTDEILDLTVTNFRLPDIYTGQEEGEVYPSKEGTMYTTGMSIGANPSWTYYANQWYMVFEKNSVYVGRHKFIRAQGKKTMHSELGILGTGQTHDYQFEGIPAQGCVLYTCKVCGHSYKGDLPYYGFINGVAIVRVENALAYHVVGITSEAPANLVIPHTYAGFPVISIDSWAISHGQLGMVVLPAGVTKADPKTFTSIEIPSSVTDIGSNAFSGCTNVTSIRYHGTIAKWKEIAQNSWWYDDLPAAKVICTDGTITAASMAPQPIHVNGVQINKTTLNLKVGDTQQLTATVSPADADDKSVTWSSSNSSVVQVTSSGRITAKGEGSAVITVTTKDGGYTASCNVSVSVIRVSGISLDQSVLDMTIGQTQQLTATVSPSNADNKNVTWTSSNSSVAQVSSTGKITAKGKGSAIITVSTTDGNFTATCAVTVTEPELTVKASLSVAFISTSSSFVQAVCAKATASGGSGEYVEYYIKVYYNGVLVAEDAANEMYVTLRSGTYTAEVYVKDSSGNEATGTVEMFISGF